MSTSDSIGTNALVVERLDTIPAELEHTSKMVLGLYRNPTA